MSGNECFGFGILLLEFWVTRAEIEAWTDYLSA